MTTIAMEMMMLLMLSTGEDPPNMYRPGPKGSFLMLIIQEFIYMYTMKAGHPRKPVSGLRGGLGNHDHGNTLSANVACIHLL
jgi:hypothetical protein